MTRCDYQCRHCHKIWEVERGMKDVTPILCPTCNVPAVAYFGRMNDVAINYGFRPYRYGNKVDRNIAQFQFTNL